MSVYEGAHETEFAASAEAAFAVLTDYESLPEWQGALRRCTVLSRDPDGLGREVEYEVDLKLRTATYRLRHDYARPERIDSTYLGGDFACFEGGWVFAEARGATRARLALRIDPGFRVPGRIAKMVNDRVLKASVENLRQRLEG
jgi:ribosome-associated toxin RatA of RatAB toxin-antitoxin module